MGNSFILITIVALVSVSSADLPSDSIKTAPLPSKMSLTGTTIDSINRIDKTHEPLGMWKNFEVPNIGHYSSWAIPIVQGNDSREGVPRSLLNWSNQDISQYVTNSVGPKKSSKDYLQLNDMTKPTLIEASKDLSDIQSNNTTNTTGPTVINDVLVWLNP